MSMQLPENSRAYDNSMISDFRKCHRYYYLRHVRDFTSVFTSHNLIFGLCWHSAMDIVWLKASSDISDADLLRESHDAFMETWKEHYPEYTDESFGSTDDELYPKTPGRALEMLAWYIKTKRKQIAGWKILGIELPFIVPLPALENVFYVGRNDKVVEKEDQRVYVVDHKTTKTDKDYFINSFFPNSQVDGYNYSGLMTYGDKYWGMRIDGALCQKGTARTWKDPVYPVGIGFPFHELMAVTGHTTAWLWETQYEITLLESHLQMLEEDCKVGDEVLKAFDKNAPTACGYYSGCIYRNICAYVVNPAQLEGPPEGFKEEKWSPFTVLDPEKLVAGGDE